MNSFVELLITLPVWALFVLALTQTGRLCFSLVHYPFADEMEEASFSFALAAALFATGIWALGLLSLLTPSSIGVLLAIVMGLWLSTLRTFGSWAVRLARSMQTQFKTTNRFEALLALVGALTLLVTLLAVASPQLGRDALAYHYYCPKEFIQKGSLYAVPYSVNAFQPLLVQMLYLQGLMFHSELFGKLYVLGFLLATVLAMGSAARIFVPQARGTAAALSLFVAAGFMAQVPYAYTDVALSFFLFLSFYALWRYFREPSPIFAAVSGFFAGVALAVKLLAVPAAAALFLLLVWQAVSKKGGAKAIGLFILFALLPCIGWYLRSWIATGNPVFPYFNQFFTGHPWASDIRDQTGIGRSLWALIQSPVLFFTDPKPFGGGDSQIGILILLAAPLVAALPLKKGDKAKLLFLALFQFLFWFYLVQHYRFLFPLFPVLYFLVGLSLESLFSQHNKMWTPYKALIVGAVLLQAAFIFYYNGKLSRYLTFPSKDSYLRATERSYPAALWANKNLPKESKLLIYNEPSQYYFNIPTAREDIVLGLEPELAQKSAVDLLGIMAGRGFTHLMTRQTAETENSPLVRPETQGRLKLLREEKFSYGDDRSLVRIYEIARV